MNYKEVDSIKKAYESAQKDAQEYIRNNICTGEPVENGKTNR